MGLSFFFYDLETSGFHPRSDRIMQFGGQRTGLQLKPIGEPVNVLVKLTQDVLPSPDAILITGITPQQTISDGITEAEFVKLFNQEINLPGTIFVGFNSVRFDDEFMRFFMYRNFNDAYEWQWKDNRGRWDLLDVVRMTRALRPDGIKWPVDSSGKPANRLELLASMNKLQHSNAHDALSDVEATIDLAKLLKQKQGKLFEYLLDNRDKRHVAALVNAGKPFVYTSGKYPGEFGHTTVVTKLVDNPKKQGALVYDLRYDPKEYVNLSPSELADKWKWKKDSDEPRLPVKTLQHNRCPAVAPLGVLDDKSQERLKIDLNQVAKNLKTLQEADSFVDNLLRAVEILNKEQQASLISSEHDVDSQLYDGFIPDSDKKQMQKVRDADAKQLSSLDVNFSDERLNALLPLYKARNFPSSLSDSEKAKWDRFVENKILKSQEPKLRTYLERIAELSEQKGLSQQKKYLLEELRLYGEGLMP